METIRSLFSKCGCFPSPSSPTRKGSFDSVDVVHETHTVPKLVELPTPSPSPATESFKNNTDKITNNTSIVLAHGAFHTTWHYQLFCDAVHKHTNIDRVVVPQQSCASSSPPADAFEADIKTMHNAVVQELRDGRDVLLVCHSYGGIPGCEALANLPTNTPGRILGIVFVTAFVAEAGQSLVTCKLATPASWVYLEGTLFYVQNPLPTLYSSTPVAFATECVSRLTPQAMSCFITPANSETWKNYPCYYVRCVKDKAMSVEEQNHFIERLQKFCPETTKVKDVDSDHAPFASNPENLAGYLEEVVGELRK